MIDRGDRPRRVLPEWRSPFANAGRAEVGPLSELTAAAVRSSVVDRGDLQRALQDWRLNRGPRFASDLVAVAVAVGEPLAAEDAARQLLQDSATPELARRLATQLLHGTSHNLAHSIVEEDRLAIARVKRLVRNDPRNVLGWVELARMYTSLGQSDSAADAMRIALAGAPTHRFVLRSASRLLVQQNEPEKAHRLISRNPRTPEDPWLLATEIATASLLERPSPHSRQARRLLEDGRFGEPDLTELASALGTVDLEAGTDRRARLLFERSLRSPNDNALAQAESVASQVNLPGLAPQLARDASSFEAKALAASTRGETRAAIDYAWSWLLDQPFAMEPASFGSHLASRIGRFDEGLQFLERGLRANPGAPMLLNNQAFCMARSGRAREARAVLSSLNTARLSEHDAPFVRATEGLVAFRLGRPEEGRAKYLQALRQIADPANATLAIVMLAIEESRLNGPDSGQFAELARIRAQKHFSRGMRQWLVQLDEAQTTSVVSLRLPRRESQP